MALATDVERAILARERAALRRLGILAGTTRVYRSRRPARIEGYTGPRGPISSHASALGVRSTVGVPIVVDGSRLLRDEADGTATDLASWGLIERVEARGGTLDISSPVNGGTPLRVALPVQH